MARRKNVKRFDPRYFLHETVNRNDDGSALEEASYMPGYDLHKAPGPGIGVRDPSTGGDIPWDKVPCDKRGKKRPDWIARKNYNYADLQGKCDDALEEASFSPLSATKPGERIPEPGSRRPLENRPEIPAALKRMEEELASTRAAVDKTIEWLQRYDKQDHWEALNSIIYRTDEDHNPFYDIHKNLDALDATLGKLQGSTAHDDPRAPKLEE